MEKLLWMVRAYRVWSLGVFAIAVLHLLAVGDFPSFFVSFLVLFPFGLALGMAYKLGDATSKWIIVFLILVDLGVIIAPIHQVLPFLNLFPGLPLTQSRILSWYLLVYFTLQYVVSPPVFFGRSLRIAWVGGKPSLNSWICCFGLAAWLFMVSIVCLAFVFK